MERRAAVDALRMFAKSRYARPHSRAHFEDHKSRSQERVGWRGCLRPPPHKANNFHYHVFVGNGAERNIDARARLAHRWLVHRPQPEGMKTTPGKPYTPGWAGVTLRRVNPSRAAPFWTCVKRVYHLMGGNARYAPRPTLVIGPRRYRSAMYSFGIHTSERIQTATIEGLVATGDQVFANINTIVTSNQ